MILKVGESAPLSAGAVMCDIRTTVNFILSLSVGTFLVCSGMLAFAAGKQTLLSCKRSSPPSGYCLFTETNLLLNETKTIPLGTISNVEVETRIGSSPSKKFYRAVIHTFEYTVPLEWTLGKAHDAQKLNSFLQDSSQTDLVIETDTRGLGRLLGWVFLVPGIIVLAPAAFKLIMRNR
jgi:hypothetical protein